MKILGTLVVTLMGAGLVGCGGHEASSLRRTASTEEDGPKTDPGVTIQLDSGNAAYRGKDYAGALAHYRRAADQQPELAAAWFGIYMAQSAVGNRIAADSAMVHVQALNPGTMSAHPVSLQDSLPANHPPLTSPSLPGGSDGDPAARSPASTSRAPVPAR